MEYFGIRRNAELYNLYGKSDIIKVIKQGAIR